MNIAVSVGHNNVCQQWFYFRSDCFRDLKCENLLLDNANHLKVTDFGFARNFEPGDISKTFCGSAAYAAPEILQGQPYHLPLHDVWAMGVILYIMVSSLLHLVYGVIL